MTARILCAGALILAAGAASAQQVTQSGQNGDWSFFASANPKECWAAAQPSASTATNGGKTVQVNRGDIRLYVTYKGQTPEVSFAGGYPFASGSNVTLDVGGTKFELFTDGEWAWPAPADDARVVAALKGGSSATVTGRSQRGNVTRDTFSLKGVTAAIDEAAKLCR